jgi:hypothetical protein
MLSHVSGLSGNHGKLRQEIHRSEHPVAWYFISTALSVKAAAISTVKRFLQCKLVPATGLVA